MPVNQTTSNLYLQLGIAGATLLILLVFIILLFSFISDNKRLKGKTEASKIDRLIDKIDQLITSNAGYTKELNTVLLSNDKDQKETIKILDTILSVVLDTQRRIVRVDDRTFACLGKEEYKKEGEN
jgi:hypothetical protein